MVEKKSESGSDAGCTACEMAVTWIKNRVKLNDTEDQILDYVNQVKQKYLLFSMNPRKSMS